ncbi:ankyrin repeat-containing domain protein [Lactarius akahatsu]|uniref:Ankyrin repeat-containing domain protein n=1 Tax=Lactarius akahatsu TaxID=416441 RepID=A0AAD4QHP2_9AGAM|nr:ankyrin repeat-containing domain protein [Lactarius akahatsu]
MALPYGSAKSVGLLIQHGVDVNSRDQSHRTRLHLASSTGSVKTLHLASSSGSAEAVRLLIQHGADVTAKDDSDSTP